MAIEKIKILGALLELPAKQHCQSSPFTSKLGQIGQIGSAVQLVAPKGLPGFWFQLPWVPNIFFWILNRLRLYMYIPNSVAKTLQTKTPDLNKYCDRNYMSWIETKFCHIIGNHGELLFLKDHFYFYPPTFSHARCISFDVHIITNNNCQSGIYPALHKAHLLPPIFLPSLFPLMFLSTYINLYALSWPISN